MASKIGAPKAPPAKDAAPVAPTHAYHAVGVRTGSDGCDAARAMRGARMLSKDAPRLPLPECDRPARCTCRYQHFDDRREKPRRRAEGSPPDGAALAVDERRHLSGRRDEDQPDDGSVEDSSDDVDTYYGFRRRHD